MKTEEKIPRIFWLFVVTLLYSLVEGTAVTLNDEGWILGVLKAGDPYAYILSFPLSFLLVLLYKILPSLPWFSALLASGLLTFAYQQSYLVRNAWRSNRAHGLLIFAVSYCTFLYSVYEPTITVITLLLICSATVYWLREKKPQPMVFLALLIFGFSLRGPWLAPVIAPLFAGLLVALALFRSRDFAKRTALILLIATAPILVIHQAAYSINPDAHRWISFLGNKAAIGDYDTFWYNTRGATDDEIKLLRNFWFFDPGLLSDQRLAEIAPTTGMIAKSAIPKILSWSGTLERLQQKAHYYLAFILLGILLATGRPKRWRAAVLVSGAIFVTLMYQTLREVPRVQYGLVIVFVSVLSLLVLEQKRLGKMKKGRSLLNAAMLLLAVFFVSKDSVLIGGRIQAAEKNRWNNAGYFADLQYYRRKYPGYRLIPGLTFPVNGYDLYCLQLFQEDKNLVDLSLLIAAGSYYRSPLYWRGLAEVGAKTPYELVTHPKVAFFGVWHTQSPEMLDLLDRKFPAKGCRHQVKQLETTGFSALAQITRVCEGAH